MTDFVHQLEGVGLAGSVAVLRTASYEVQGKEHLASLDRGRAIFVAAWHGQSHLLMGFVRSYLKGYRMRFIVPDDARGVALATGGRLLGFQPFRISMQDQSFSAARRTLELIRSLKGGDVAYINPDGPDGPPRVAKDGVAFIASRAGAQLLPVGAFTRTAYRLRRWDRYAVPLPFSRITVVVRPAFVPARDQDRASILSQLSQEMTRAVEEAEALHLGRG